MLEKMCAECRNYFVSNIRFGIFKIEDGAIEPLDFLQEGQYFRIVGSVLNDGVYQYPSSDLVDETFDGAVWAMSVPPSFIALSAEIKDWQDFSDFGNQRELLRIMDLFYETFKKGQAKQIRKSLVEGTPLEPIVSKYAVGVTKSGGIAKSFTLLDVVSIMRESEDAIKAVGMCDLSDIDKVRNFYDVMGYIGYVSGKEEDRRKLYILDIFPVSRRSDKRQFGYSVITKSIGSGKESRFTVFNAVYKKEPIVKGDIILCKGFEREGQYFKLTNYEKVF